MGSIEGRQPVQLSFLCPCGKRIALKALGCCRSCYDRRHHSLRFFGGLRERGAAVATWVYYRAVSVVKLSPSQGSAILLIGGTISTAGLVLGVWMSERVGRVNSVVILGLGGVVGVLAFYWGPPANFAWPRLWLLVAQNLVCRRRPRHFGSCELRGY